MTMMHFDDISDNEIRIINRQEAPRRPFYRRWWFWAAAVVIAAVAAVVIFGLSGKARQTAETPQPGEVSEVESTPTSPTEVVHEPAYVISSDTAVNDVPLTLYTPVNAVPELMIGNPSEKDESIVLAVQAADIRADNREILGSYVLKGELVSRGGGKKEGFCAILGGDIQLGVAENTDLFEKAIETGGYFFRQYPLVSEGIMIDNKPKGKTLRAALCELDGRMVVVRSRDDESFHDFAQALADLGVNFAINLVGSSHAYGFYREKSDDGSTVSSSWGKLQTGAKNSNVNYIMWKARD